VAKAPSGPIDITQPAVFAPLPEGAAPPEPARRNLPPPDYAEWQDVYDEVIEPTPPAAPVQAAAPEQGQPGFVSTDWSKLRRITNGELADEEWMGGPEPTAGRPAPQRAEWQRVALFASAIVAIIAMGIALVIWLWPSPAPASPARLSTGGTASVLPGDRRDQGSEQQRLLF
jgi:hypothetical protein